MILLKSHCVVKRKPVAVTAVCSFVPRRYEVHLHTLWCELATLYTRTITCDQPTV